MTFDIIYTPEEKKAMTQLREKVMDLYHPLIHDDFHYFYRFLKARNFNMDQAESMLRKHIQWAKSLQLDTMLEDYTPPEVVKKYIATSFLGYDKDGSILRIMHVGKTDFRGVMKSTNKIHIFKNTLIVCLEDSIRLKEQCKKLKKVFLPTTLILDCTDLTLSKVTDSAAIQVFINDLTAFQDNFPECLKKIFIINASIYFTMMYSLVKKILVGPIVEKINVFGEDGWKEELQKIVDLDVLPACLGGKRTDPDGDPMCKTIITYGGPVPERYYLEKNIENFASQNGVKKVTIARGESFEEKVEVEHENSILEWEFEVKSSTIGIKIGLEEVRGDTKTIKVIVPVYIYETEYEPLKGKLKCECSGTYIFILSNKHSWFHSKEVYYRTSVKLCK